MLIVPSSCLLYTIMVIQSNDIWIYGDKIDKNNFNNFLNLNVNMHDKTNKARNLRYKYRRQFMRTAEE